MGGFSGSLGSLWVEVGAKIANFEKSMADVSESVGETVKGVEKSFAGLDKLGGQLKGIGTGLTASVSLPLLGAAVAATKFSTDFNASMANVATLIPGNTARVNELKTSVQNMAIQTGKSTADLADGLYQVVSAFGDTAESTKLLDINARAAAAGVATTLDAINLTSAVTKGYGDTSAEAVQKVSDLAFQTVKLGQTTFPELASSMGRVTPLAAALAVTQEELFAVMATGTGVTGTASEVSTQLRGVLQSLMAPTDTMTQLFKQMGVESGKALLEQHGLQGAIELLVKSAERSGVPLQKLVGSIEGQTLAMALAGPQAETLTSKMAAMQNVVGVADQAFRDQTEGINSQGFAMKQLQQQIAVTAQRFGDSLAPALGRILQSAKGVLDWLVSAVEWFAKLPASVQSAAIGLGALAIAIGPVLVVAGTLIGSISTLYTGFGLLAGAGGIVPLVAKSFSMLTPLLVAAGAALVAIQFTEVASAAGGLWDALTRTSTAAGQSKGLFDDLKTAIFGVDEAASTASGSLDKVTDSAQGASTITAFFSDVMSRLSDRISSIKWTDFLTPLGPLRTAINRVTEAVMTLRGVFPDMETAGTAALDKLKKSNQDSMRAAADHAMEIVNVGKKQKTTTTAIRGASVELTKTAKAHKEAAMKAKEFGDAILIEKLKIWNTEHRNLAKSVAEGEIALAKYNATAHPLIQTNESLNASIQALHASAINLGETSVPGMNAAVDAAGESMRQLDEDFKRLGVTSTESFNTQATEATAAYERIKTSGLATARDIDFAWVTMERARIDAAKAAGQEIPKEQLAALAEMERQLGLSTATQKDAWSGLTTQVSTIITNFAQDMAKSLWEGGTSWSEKGKTALKSLGEAVTSFFIEPATKALSTFISGALADLLGGKGLGGISKRISDIGTSISGLFGGGAGAAKTPVVPGGVNPAGLAGAAGSAGLTSVIGAVSGVATAVSSIIGNFQAAKQESSLNAIEENTRFSSLRVLSLLENSNAYFPKVAELRGDFSTYLTAFASLMTTTEEARDHVRNNLAGIKAAATSTVEHLLGLHATSQSSLMSGREATSHLAMIRELLSIGANRPNVTINISGTATAADGESVMAALRAQGIA